MKSAWPAPSVTPPTVPTTVAGAALAAILIGVGIGAFGIATLAVVAGPLAVITAWHRPGIVVALYIGMPYYKPSIDPLLPADLTVALASLCTLAAVPLVADLVRGQGMVIWRAIAPVLVVLVVLGVGALYAVDADRALADVSDFALLTVIPGLVAIRAASVQDGRRDVVVTTLALGVITVVIGLSRIDQLGEFERLTTFGANTIGTARIAVLVPLLGLTYAWTMRTMRPFVLLLIPPALVVALSTGSRGPILMGAVTLGLMALAAAAQSRQRGTAGIVILLGVLAVTPLLDPVLLADVVPKIALDRIIGVTDSVRGLFTGEADTLSASDRGRIDSWALALDMFQARPLFGWGTSSFASFTPAIGWDILTYPHNLILQALAEHGLVGAVVVGGILGAGVVRSLRPMPDITAFALATIYLFLLLNAMVSNSIVNNRPLWLALVMVLTIPLVSRQDTEHVISPSAQP